MQSKEKKFYLALDLGASSGKMVLGKYDGSVLDTELIHEFPNGGIEVGGNLYWDILQLFNQIKKGLKKVSQKTGNDLQSVGVDTWGVDYGLLDQNDQLLSNPYHYRDQRTEGLMEEVIQKAGREAIYQKTGIEFIFFNTLYQLYADYKYRPHVLDNAQSLLFTPDLLNYFLCGEKYNEYTIASTSQLFNPRTESWVDSLLQELNLPRDIFADLIHPGQEIKQISPAIQKECRLNSDVQVTSVGSHDTESALAAVPFESPESSVFLSSGTWSLLGMELDEPLINEQSLQKNFTNECGVGQKIAFLKNLCGLWLIQECRRSWNREGQDLSYGQIDRAARRARGNKFIIDPNEERFKNPADMPREIKEYCRETKQPVPENYGQMARGIYESLALSYKKVITDLEELLDKKITTVNIVGGGCRSEMLNQMTAEITGLRVVTGPVQATALGNILAQLMAAGKISDLKEGRELIRNSVELKEYTPGD